MKISKLFHWLYALLMFLPIVNVFSYILRYGFNYGNEIPSVSENVQKTVNFNQLQYEYNESYGSINVNFDSNLECFHITGSSTTSSYIGFGDIYNVNNSKILLRIEDVSNCPSSLSYRSGYDNYPSVNLTQGANIGIASTYIGLQLLGFEDNANLDFYVRLECFDLTQMFGVGNEPTVQEFLGWFPDSYYDYTLSEYVVIPNYSSVSVSDDVTNHFWLPQFGHVGHTINNVISFLLSNVFGLVVSEGIGYIVCGLFTYWLVISLSWLVFDLLMYVPLLVHRWLDKASIS